MSDLRWEVRDGKLRQGGRELRVRHKLINTTFMSTLSLKGKGVFSRFIERVGYNHHDNLLRYTLK
jgi:hypothetical protein